MAEDGSGSGKWWFTGILGPIIVGLVIWYLTSSNSPFHHPKPPVTAGSIEAVNRNSGTPCCTFSVKALIQGYDGQTCPLWATIIDANTGAQGTPFQVNGYVPQAGEDEGAFNDYVPITRSGSYIVRFTLYAPNGTELDQRDSSQVNVTAG